jgi:hypothetical protein
MDLITISEQPDGFCPPEVSVKILKVWERKSGENETGVWSFQNVDVEQGGTKATIKLKNLPEFPSTRVGQSVVITAHKSDKHGLTGIKTETREYNGKTYRSIVVTPSAKWAWGTASENGNAPSAAKAQAGLVLDSSAYGDHILAVAEIARQVSSALLISDEPAIQACFATICIDTKSRNILLPKPNGHVPEEAPNVETNPFDEPPDDDIPF